jgi:hypothetical protein
VVADAREGATRHCGRAHAPNIEFFTRGCDSALSKSGGEPGVALTAALIIASPENRVVSFLGGDSGRFCLSWTQRLYERRVPADQPSRPASQAPPPGRPHLGGPVATAGCVSEGRPGGGPLRGLNQSPKGDFVAGGRDLSRRLALA